MAKFLERVTPCVGVGGETICTQLIYAGKQETTLMIVIANFVITKKSVVAMKKTKMMIKVDGVVVIQPLPFLYF